MITSSNLGFTLIELSIVLVIIGLIVGGVLVGQDLIHIAQIRKTVSTISDIQTSVNSFKLKFGCLPGDCVNADTIFSNDAAINGNGDGIINRPDPSSPTEEFNIAFLQLRSAGLYADINNGSYYYNGGMSIIDCISDKFVDSNYAWCFPNVPGKIQSVFVVGQMTSPNSHASSNNQIYSLGTGYDFNLASVFTPSEAQAIDSKLDDGFPMSGNVIAGSGGDNNINPKIYDPTSGIGGAANNVCVDNSVTPNVYNVQNNTTLCNFQMLNAGF